MAHEVSLQSTRHLRWTFINGIQKPPLQVQIAYVPGSIPLLFDRKKTQVANQISPRGQTGMYTEVSNSQSALAHCSKITHTLEAVTHIPLEEATHTLAFKNPSRSSLP
jgi:hypothetical protein